MKFCQNCNAQLPDEAIFCNLCGTKYEQSEEVKAEPEAVCATEEACHEEAKAAPVAVATASEAPKASAAPTIPAVDPKKPKLQLATNRGLAKYFFLGLITFGIYNMVVMSRIPDEINMVASRYDGRKTMPYFAMLMLSPLTSGIITFVWIHNLCDRIGLELRRRGYDYKFGAATFWLWDILGSLIVVGPFIYIHKLMKSMNLINKSYNMYG